MGVKMNKKITIIALIGIALDQIIKFLLSNNLRITIIPDFFYITSATNTGGAWGIFGNHTYWLVAISIVFMGLLIYYIKGETNKTKLEETAYGMLIAGVIGNMIDRIFLGLVRDYLDFYILNYDFPIFNLADSLIVIAVFILIIEEVRGAHNEYNSKRRK